MRGCMEERVLLCLITKMFGLTFNRLRIHLLCHTISILVHVLGGNPL